MSALRVSLFGKFCVSWEQDPLQGFEPLKVQELFCYLLLFRARPHPRENLAGMLWGENPTSQAKRYLSKALWQLQEALSPVMYGENLLMIAPEWIQLQPNTAFWFDVAAFEQAYQLVQDVPGGEIDGAKVQVIQEAVRWYRGDLLEGWYQDWCLCERERLQFLYLSLLDKLVRYYEAQGAFDAGRLFAYQILSYDRAREQTHRQLMRLYWMAGDRTGALRQYQQCREILKEELGVEPAQPTEELYRRIQAGAPIPPDPGLPSPRPPEPDYPKDPAEDPLWKVIGKMKQVRLDLEALENDLNALVGSTGSANGKET